MQKEKPNCYSSTAIHCAGNCFNCPFHTEYNGNLSCCPGFGCLQKNSTLLPSCRINTMVNTFQLKRKLNNFYYHSFTSVLFRPIKFQQTALTAVTRFFPLTNVKYRNQLYVTFPLNQVKKISYLFSRGRRSFLNSTKKSST